jgi:hypothetical protein
MLAIPLSGGEQQAFARAALHLRYDVPETAPIAAERLLHARRPEQVDASIWNTFKRVQENAIRSGLRGADANHRRGRTREVTGIDQPQIEQGLVGPGRRDG